MRCPKCGSENSPDSRFCGVCGLQQTPPARLAATAKIPDDAPLAPPTRPVAPVSGMPGVSYAPPSMPPHNAHHAGLAPPQQAGLVTKPGGHAAPPRPSGEQGQVRPSGGYGVVQRGPSQPFDSITPTGERRIPTPVPGTQPRPSSQQRAPQRTPMASNPSMSFSNAAPSRPLGLIAIVLVIDLGLAGAGAFLLSKGLGSPSKAAPDKKTEAPDKKTEAPAAPTPTQSAAAAPAGSADTASVTAQPITEPPATTPATPTTATAAASTTPTATRTRTTTTRSPGPTTSPSGPVTSPGGVTSPDAVPVNSVPTAVQPKLSTEAEINALAARSRASFDKCRGDQTVAGTIDVVLQVMPDGTLTNVAPIENTTGNAQLASCLVRIISGWRVSPFDGNAMQFVRPFTYQ